MWWMAERHLARSNIHTLILACIPRCILTEVTQVVVELDCKVATHNTIPRVLCVTATYVANKGCILIQKVINTNHNLTTLALEKLLTEVQVTDKIVLVVAIRKADILIVVNSRCKREALPEHLLQRTRCRMAEVLVLTTCCR